MTPKWVFERDVYQDGNVEQMIAYCDSRQIPQQLVQVVAFGDDQHIKWKFPEEDCVIVYGSIAFARHVNRKKKWIPGAWCDFEKLRCTSYLAHWGRYSVHHNYALLPLAELTRQKDSLFHRYAIDEHIFIRPDTNDKIFHGEKVHYDQYNNWWRVSNIYDPSPEQLTMVSTPSIIKIEWRFIIADRQAITGSRYIHTDDGNVSHAALGEHILDSSAAEFATEIANSTDWQPAPIYSLDVCSILNPVTLENSFKLLECGSVNCSGLYKCNLEVIMDAAEKIALREWNDLHV